mgnify:CR=1 FL=1
MARSLGLGGSERQLALMARHLDRRRFEVRVACFRCQGVRAEELRAEGVPLLDVGLRSLRGASAVTGARRLLRCLREQKIEIVHSFDAPATFFAVPLARAARVPVVLSSQRAHRELSASWERYLLRLTDRIAVAIVVNCEFLKRHLVDDERVPAERIRVCYNGIELDRFSPAGRGKPAEFGCARLVVGTVCALRPEKGLDVLVSAFARLRVAVPDALLVIAGDGPVRNDLLRQAESLGLGQSCRFLPARGEVAELLRGIDIFVLPSRSEALSNALMEAMACGCTVVATRVGGNPELVEHGKTGILVAPGDAAELACALEFLAGDEEARKRLAANGAAFIRSRFSVEIAAQRLAEIYEEFLSR